jgi:hypothetical protein
VATVERLDSASRQLHLRAADGRRNVVGFGADTSVIYRGRDYPIDQLAPGDVIAMQLKHDGAGRPYTDLIRVQRASGAERESGAAGVESIAGTVADVDFERHSFELHGSAGERMLVTLPDNAPKDELDRFSKLKPGDYVRVEARSLGPQRFELEGFAAGK